LYIFYDITDEISNWFSLEKNDSKELIGRWVSDRLQLEVKNTRELRYSKPNTLAIDYN